MATLRRPIVVEENESKGDHYMKSDVLMHAIHEGNTEACKHMLEQGALHSCRMLGQDALGTAVQHSFVEAVKLLLDYGAQPEATHLCHACIVGRANGAVIVELLIKAGADPNAKSTMSPPFTALMHAASNGHGGVVSLLLRAKAMPNSGFDDHVPQPNAIELAEARGHAHVVALLEPWRLPTLASLLSSIEGSDCHATLRAWLARGGSPSYRFVARTSDGRVRMPLLVYAAMYGQQASVVALLQMGAFIDAAIIADRDDAPSDGMTALMVACREGHVSIVQLLLAQGANWALRTNDGQSVLAFAHPSCAVLVHAHHMQRMQAMQAMHPQAMHPQATTPQPPQKVVTAAGGVGVPICATTYGSSYANSTEAMRAREYGFDPCPVSQATASGTVASSAPSGAAAGAAAGETTLGTAVGGEEKKKRGGKKKGEGWKITQRMRAAFILEDQNTEHEVVSSSVDGSNSVGQGGGATMTVEGQLTPVTDAYASLSLAPTPSAPSLSEPSPLPAQPAPPAPPAPPPAPPHATEGNQEPSVTSVASTGTGTGGAGAGGGGIGKWLHHFTRRLKEAYGDAPIDEMMRATTRATSFDPFEGIER